MKPFVHSRSNGFFDQFQWGITRNEASLIKSFGNIISNMPFVSREAAASAKTYNAKAQQSIMRMTKGPRF